MIGHESTLHAYLGGNKIAKLTLIADQLVWQYTDIWRQSGYPVSPHLPLHGEIPALNVQRFLRNMFPEGIVLDELLDTFRLSRTNTFGLIQALGLDIPGAIVMLNDNQELPRHAQFRVVSDEEMIQRLNQREDHSMIVWDGKPRLSVAGVQEKINIVMNGEEIGFGEGSLCSTHIMKFEKAKIANLVLNEFLSMRLAKQCGLSVANVELRKFDKHRVLLIERFDRKMVSFEEVKRRHIIDGCQALNLPPEYKYEQNFGSSRDVAHIRDGVSFKNLFEVTKLCVSPALAKKQILDWALFNILIYNFDAHGKNISFYVSQDGLALAPFYDLVNIKIYPHLDHSMAMALGDAFDGRKIHAYELADFSDSCHIPRQLVVSRLKVLIRKLMTSVDGAIRQINVTEPENLFLARYRGMVLENCLHIQEQIDLIKDVQM